MLQIAVCDDNIHAVSGLVGMLQKIIETNDLEAKIIFHGTCLDTLDASIANSSPNLFFLDINLRSRQTGFEYALKLREQNKSAYIVFISGHLEFVFQSFKARPFTFLPKPVVMEVLEQTMLDIYKDYFDDSSSENPQNLEFRSSGKLVKLKFSDVLALEKDDHRLYIHSVHGHYTCWSSLDEIGTKLPTPDFIRIHKSFIVNSKFVNEINTHEGSVKITSGLSFPIGRTYRKSVVEHFNKHAD